jgi:hypothetical protein
MRSLGQTLRVVRFRQFGAVTAIGVALAACDSDRALRPEASSESRHLPALADTAYGIEPPAETWMRTMQPGSREEFESTQSWAGSVVGPSAAAYEETRVETAYYTAWVDIVHPKASAEAATSGTTHTGPNICYQTVEGETQNGFEFPVGFNDFDFGTCSYVKTFDINCREGGGAGIFMEVFHEVHWPKTPQYTALYLKHRHQREANCAETTSGGGGGGGGGGGNQVCFIVTIEGSHDGGVTWVPLLTRTVCSS